MTFSVIKRKGMYCDCLYFFLYDTNFENHEWIKTGKFESKTVHNRWRGFYRFLFMVLRTPKQKIFHQQILVISKHY